MTPMEIAVQLAEVRGWQVERLGTAGVSEVDAKGARSLVDTYVITHPTDTHIRSVASIIIADTDLGLQRLCKMLGEGVQAS